MSIADYPPHLILLSIQLPRLDGYHFCRIVRKNLQFARIPVIMLGSKEDSTSYGLHNHFAGSTDFLMKPFDSHQIVQVVNKYLPGF
ncbi:response regulator [Tengunoibacter tsumagoiensis]|uniref:response regulator n=1 Tax=Tengunoibacter tsumagoiensis TaxID=2014871 RepID=UPI000F8453DD|nr:response regulator [Tengunoibacter tsumagoiensis]